SNGAVVTQTFTLNVDQAPAFTTGPSATFTLGKFDAFGISTTGFPDAQITVVGNLPAGLTLVQFPGTALLEGTPTGPGDYPVTLYATNKIGSATQAFTIHVNQAAAITSSNAVTFTVGQPSSFTVTT